MLAIMQILLLVILSIRLGLSLGQPQFEATAAEVAEVTVRKNLSLVLIATPIVSCFRFMNI